MNLKQRSRRMRNLLFVFVFFCALLSLHAFSGKAIKKIKHFSQTPQKYETMDSSFKQFKP